MKLQFVEITSQDPEMSTIKEIEVTSFEDAIRQTLFAPNYVPEQYEIDNVVASFTKTPSMWFALDDAIQQYYFIVG